MSGWIKLHRKILDNPVVCKDGDHVSVWMYLLLNATHKEYPAMFAGERITLQPGQLITGRKSISEKFDISESKVQRILKLFENEQQIEQQSSNKNRLISIVSWSDYQEDEQQTEQPVNNKRTTTEQQVNTNKNVKNVKNEENEIKDINPYRVLEENRFPFMTPILKDKVDSLVEDFGIDEFVEAVTESVVRGKRNIPYVTRILENWRLEGKGKQKSKEDRLSFIDDL